MYSFGRTSQSNLIGVHIDLIKVANRALKISKYDFGISEGLRALEREKKMVAEGKSMTLNSKHLKQSDGFGHAIDVFGYVNGKADYSEEVMDKIAQAFFTAAIELGVQIQWGGFWKVPKDMPHFQLNGEYYG